MLRIALTLVGVGVAVYVALWAWVALSIPRTGTLQRAPVAIVLGASAFRNGAWNPCLVARVRQGVRLLEAGRVEKLILSGGFDVEDGALEAAVMRDIAVHYGANAGNLTLEPRATSTAENLEFSQAIMREQSLGDTAIIVSDPYHLPRAGLIARKLGLTAGLEPAPDSPCWTQGFMFSRNSLREPIALVENWLRGNL
jgi:uncharacterized SAM-binding protein YcdF (DUF218 family)